MSWLTFIAVMTGIAALFSFPFLFTYFLLHMAVALLEAFGLVWDSIGDDTDDDDSPQTLTPP